MAWVIGKIWMARSLHLQLLKTAYVLEKQITNVQF